MKKPIIILDPGEIWYNLDEMSPFVDNVLSILEKHPEIVSIKYNKNSHYTMLDYINNIRKDVDDIMSMVTKGRTCDY